MKTIHLATAQCWLHKMQYYWTNTPKGQYVDGHECEDFVAYWQTVFLPKLAAINAKLRTWTKDGIEDPNAATIPNTHHIVVWYHDESIFYVNNRQTKWVGRDKTPVLQPKGEGASLMV